MSAKELWIAGIVSLILWIFAMEYLIEIPFIGFIIAWGGWLIPVVFLYGAWEESNKELKK